MLSQSVCDAWETWEKAPKDSEPGDKDPGNPFVSEILPNWRRKMLGGLWRDVLHNMEEELISDGT